MALVRGVTAACGAALKQTNNRIGNRLSNSVLRCLRCNAIPAIKNAAFALRRLTFCECNSPDTRGCISAKDSMQTRSKHGAYGSSVRAARGVWIIIAAYALMALLPILFIVWRGWPTRRSDVLPRIDLNTGHDFIYDLTQLAPNQTVLFTYPFGSENIRLALQKDSSGTIRTVVASCAACYSSRDQNEFRNGQLMCARCRQAMRFGDPDEKTTGAKSCVAVPVPFLASKQLLAVRASVIEQRVHELQSSKNQNGKLVR